MNWSAWAPTLVTVIMAIFVAGKIYSKQEDHDERLKDHDERFEQISVRDSLQDVALAKLEAWRDGYNAATSKHGS